MYLFDTRGKIKLVISTENYSMFSTGFEQSRLIGNEKKKEKILRKGISREKKPPYCSNVRALIENVDIADLRVDFSVQFR